MVLKTLTLTSGGIDILYSSNTTLNVDDASIFPPLILKCLYFQHAA
jgi:hypothetical protein